MKSLYILPVVASMLFAGVISTYLVSCSPPPKPQITRPEIDLISIKGCDYMMAVGYGHFQILHLANCTNHISNRITYELK